MNRALFAGLMVVLLIPQWGSAVEPFRLQPGDRVVLLGGTLIEREQKYGYWETALTVRFPGVSFRNLGWSGDTVFGEARASFEFGQPAVPFRRLVEGTLGLKPTVLLIAYGTNESFAGESGLSRFVMGLESLLKALEPARARTVLLSPPRHENLGRPLPDPTAQNRNLRLYSEAIRAVAAKRGHHFVNLYDALSEAAKTGPLTDNGMHMTAYGYWRSASALEAALGQEPRSWRVDLESTATPPVRVEAQKGTTVTSGTVQFSTTDELLPFPPPPLGSPTGRVGLGGDRLLRISGLASGSHTLQVDGKALVTATGAEWSKGVRLARGPEHEQVEQLRAKIIEKNREYFHRWRPQNETYLFGFRKHEQGQNAREVPLFEPLVADLEKEIAKLRVPISRRYSLVPQ